MPMSKDKAKARKVAMVKALKKTRKMRDNRDKINQLKHELQVAKLQQQIKEAKNASKDSTPKGRRLPSLDT